VKVGDTNFRILGRTRSEALIYLHVEAVQVFEYKLSVIFLAYSKKLMSFGTEVTAFQITVW